MSCYLENCDLPELLAVVQEAIAASPTAFFGTRADPRDALPRPQAPDAVPAFAVGDRVTCIRSMYRLTAGRTYEVMSVYGGGQIVVIDDAGDRYSITSRIFTRVPAAPPCFPVGSFVAADYRASMDITPGRVYQVLASTPDTLTIHDDREVFRYYCVEAFRAVPAPLPIAVGDMVKCVEAGIDRSVGKIYGPVFRSCGMFRSGLRIRDDAGDVSSLDGFVKATPGEVAHTRRVADAEAHLATLKAMTPSS